MLSRVAAVLFLIAPLHGCLVFEYEHEFWLRTDGSGSVFVTGRPELWVAFKGLGRTDDPEGTATREAARAFFEKAGLRVNRVTITRRSGQRYLFAARSFSATSTASPAAAFDFLSGRAISRYTSPTRKTIPNPISTIQSVAKTPLSPGLPSRNSA